MISSPLDPDKINQIRRLRKRRRRARKFATIIVGITRWFTRPGKETRP